MSTTAVIVVLALAALMLALSARMASLRRESAYRQRARALRRRTFVRTVMAESAKAAAPPIGEHALGARQGETGASPQMPRPL